MSESPELVKQKFPRGFYLKVALMMLLASCLPSNSNDQTLPTRVILPSATPIPFLAPASETPTPFIITSDTLIPTNTAIPTSTNSPTETSTITFTATNTPTQTPTSIPSWTPVPPPTSTNTVTPDGPTIEPTATPTSTPDSTSINNESENEEVMQIVNEINELFSSRNSPYALNIVIIQNGQTTELINVNPELELDIASSFKSLVAFYAALNGYNMNEALSNQNDPLYEVIVKSNNPLVTTVLSQVNPNTTVNPVENFNNWLNNIGVENGLNSWNGVYNSEHVTPLKVSDIVEAYSLMIDLINDPNTHPSTKENIQATFNLLAIQNNSYYSLSELAMNYFRAIGNNDLQQIFGKDGLNYPDYANGLQSISDIFVVDFGSGTYIIFGFTIEGSHEDFINGRQNGPNTYFANPDRNIDNNSGVILNELIKLIEKILTSQSN